MSYRIHLSIAKEKELKQYLSTKPEKFEFDKNILSELDCSTPIEDMNFRVIKLFKEDECPPYVLSKKDFQKILDYYKDSIHKYISEIDDLLEKMITENNQGKEIKLDRDTLSSLWSHYMYISNYFKKIIKRRINIDGSGLFLLDYFYLVKLYENIREDEVFIITHG